MFKAKVALTALEITVSRPGLVKWNINTFFISLVFQL